MAIGVLDLVVEVGGVRRDPDKGEGGELRRESEGGRRVGSGQAGSGR